MNPLSAIYGGAARLRRHWYAQRPRARRRLDVPVISVGNLVVGGSGKTPVVAALAERLRREGERPAILSRGYARRQPTRGVLVVSDGERVLATVEQSGDEPQMLARRLDGVPVLVSTDRFLAGRTAETRFGATVLLLDDGFQHVQLARDVDLLVVTAADLVDRLLPAGSLREPLDAARAAHAVIVSDDVSAHASGAAAGAPELAVALGVPHAFRLVRRYEAPRLVSPYGAETPGVESDELPPRVHQLSVRRVVAVAGIARPHRFFDALRALGWDVAAALPYPDHHWFSARDVHEVSAAARTAQADLVMTTEKDAVRLGALQSDVPWAFIPMRATIEPEAGFFDWLSGRIAMARVARSGGAARP